MGQVVFVEILSRTHKLRQRVRASEFPCTIGRGYNCSVIVDDPFIAPQEAELDIDDAGQVIFRRLNHDESTPVDAKVGLDVTLGRTRLRFRTADFQLKPTAVEPLSGTQIGRLLTSRRWQLAALLVGAIANAFAFTILAHTEGVGTSSGFTLAMFFFIGAWTMFWRAMTRGTRSRRIVVGHIATVVLAIGLMSLISEVALALQTIHPIEGRTFGLANFLTDTAVLGLAIFAHLLLAGAPHLRRALIGALAVVLALGATQVVAFFGKQGDPSDDLTMETTLRPVPAALLITEAPEDFVAQLPELKAKTLSSLDE